MKEITSRKTKKVQVVSDEVWNEVVANGWAKRYTVRDIPSKKIPPPEDIKVEPKVEPKKTEK